jgi:uncharacterized protein (TIGR03437 family)
VEVRAFAPAIFTANASGKGEAAALATIDGVNYQRPPFDLTLNGKPNILILFGIGLRGAPAADPNDDNGVAESINVKIDGRPARVLYAGAQGGFSGLDQINIELPTGLAESPGGTEREVEVELRVNGVAANRFTIRLK